MSSYKIHDMIIKELQSTYREQNNLRGDSVLEPEQMIGMKPAYLIHNDQWFCFDGNLISVGNDDDKNGRTSEGEKIIFATDAGTLGERSDQDFIKIEDERNITLDVENALIRASNSGGEIYGRDIALLATGGSDFEMRLRGGENFAAAFGEGTKVLMRDHLDPDNPDTVYQTTSNAFASDGGEVTQAAYHQGTVNYGISIEGGTINQQGAFNYGRTENSNSQLGQQGSRMVNNKLSFAQAFDGAQIMQQGEDRNSVLEAEVWDANVLQINPEGINYVETQGDQSIVSQKGRSNIVYGTGVKAIKQVNTTEGQGENMVSEALKYKWITMGPDANPENFYSSSYTNKSPFETILNDSRIKLNPGIDSITHALRTLDSTVCPTGSDNSCH